MTDYIIEAKNDRIRELETQNEILQKALNNGDFPKIWKMIEGKLQEKGFLTNSIDYEQKLKTLFELWDNDKNDVTLLRTNIESLQKEIDGLRISYNDCESRLNTTLDQCRKFKEDLENESRDHKKTLEKNIRLEEKLKEKESDFQEALAENSGLAIQVEELTEKLTTTEIENSKLRNKIEDYESMKTTVEISVKTVEKLSTEKNRHEKIIDLLLDQK